MPDADIDRAYQLTCVVLREVEDRARDLLVKRACRLMLDHIPDAHEVALNQEVYEGSLEILEIRDDAGRALAVPDDLVDEWTDGEFSVDGLNLWGVSAVLHVSSETLTVKP